jgi:hypothetical protein
MVMMPNPRALDDWPEHWDGGVHYVRPLNFGATITLLMVIAIAIGATVLLKRRKTAEQY